MLKAYVNFWKGYVNWSGKSSRAEWWWIFLCNFIIGLVLTIPSFSFIVYAVNNYGTGTADYDSSMALINSGFNPVIATIFIILLVLYGIATVVPYISLTIRRLRDAGLPWGLYFLNFIPGVGSLVVFVLMQLPAKSNDPSAF